MKEKVIVIKNGRIFTGRIFIDDGFVVVKAGRVIDVLDKDNKRDLPRHRDRVIDAKGHIVSPGFIDTHLHGGGGGDSIDADASSIAKIARTHNKFGTTSMLISVYPAPIKHMLAQMQAIKEYMEKNSKQGARVLGIHMEGPFLNPKKCGALNKRYLKEPSVKLLHKFYEASGQNIKMMTIAPDVRGGIKVIKAAEKLGIKIAVGHSDASYEEMIYAINAGVSHVTHAFNALRMTHHRDPGVMGTILINKDVTVELIADNSHLHPAVLVLAVMVKGAENIVLVTDALRITGLKGKKFYESKDKPVVVKDGMAIMKDGTIAGSILTMNKAIKNIYNTKRLSLEEAIKTATINPAKIAGVAYKKGLLLPDMDADIAVFDDNFDVKLSMVEGRITYRKKGF